MKRWIILTSVVALLPLIAGCDVIMDLIKPPAEEPPPTGILFFDDFEDSPDPA